VLEVRVAARGSLDLLERGLGERGAPQVRVHDHAGRVEDAAQTRRSGGLQLFLEPLAEIPGIGARLYLLTRVGNDRSRCLDGERGGARPCELVDGGEVAELHEAIATSKCSERSSCRDRSTRASGSITACS